MKETEPATATDQIEKHLAVAARDAAAAKILKDSGGAAIHNAIGRAQSAEAFRRMATLMEYEALLEIDESKTYNQVWSARLERPCKNIDEVTEASSLSRDKYFVLKKEIEVFGRACSSNLEFLGITWRTRKLLLSAPKTVQHQIAEALERNSDDKKAGAKEIAQIVTDLLEIERSKRQEAEAARGEMAKSKALAEEKGLKVDDKLKVSEAKVAELKTENEALKFDRDTPDYAKGDAAAIHKRIRDEQMQFSARVAYLEKHIFAPLVHWSEEGKPNHDLNRLALMILVDTLTALSHTLSGALFAFDPQQTNSDYTALWLFRSLHLAAATEADVADHEDLLAKLQEAARKSANDPEVAR